MAITLWLAQIYPLVGLHVGLCLGLFHQDLLDEVREEARVSAEAVKRRVERRHNSKVRPRHFQEGDLVMRKVHQNDMQNKLSPKWTGPYRVMETLENGAYRLETLEGGAIPRTWNTTHLKFYFS